MVPPTELYYLYSGRLFYGRLGNYWPGFNASDMDHNGVYDEPYDTGRGIDYYPLVSPPGSYIVVPGNVTRLAPVFIGVHGKRVREPLSNISISITIYNPNTVSKTYNVSIDAPPGIAPEYRWVSAELPPLSSSVIDILLVIGNVSSGNYTVTVTATDEAYPNITMSLNITVEVSLPTPIPEPPIHHYLAVLTAMALLYAVLLGKKRETR